MVKLARKNCYSRGRPSEKRLLPRKRRKEGITSTLWHEEVNGVNLNLWPVTGKGLNP